MIREFDNIKPSIAPSVFVSEKAYIVGKVKIGDYSSVWPNVVIRGDNASIEIGSGVNIQDNSVIHADSDAFYGNYVTVGHGVICHAKRVDNFVLIGNGAIINDGVSIGEYSIIGAGAVVLENVEIPPQSLVLGIPAQVKSPILEKHEELIKSTANSYISKSRKYLKLGL